MFQHISLKIKSKWYEFTQSILYYPLLFLISSLSLFLITATIDPRIPSDIQFQLLKPLIFTGSSDAARSILSAIATGWTTILGVAFSVTLITLQLSSSKYISRLIREFEYDKINQLTLGWFIFISSYSLLVLKTVRTEESDSISIPILGTNIAIAIAIMRLLIFVIYIHNISKYLRPNILISHLVNNIISSFKKYEKRKTDKKLLFYKKPFAGEITRIKSAKSGIITYVTWKKIQESLIKFDVNENLWLECYKNIGDWIGEGELFAVIYRYDKNGNISQENSNKFNSETVINNNNNNNDRDYQSSNSKHIKFDNKNQKYNDISVIDSIRNAINIAKDSSLVEDPNLGINLLGEMAIKSNNLRDYDVVNSLIIGLFRILIFGYTSEDKLGLPFTVSSKEPKFQKLRQIKSIKNNSMTKNLTKQLETGQKNKRETSSSNSNEKNNKERIIIINPRELKI